MTKCRFSEMSSSHVTPEGPAWQKVRSTLNDHAISCQSEGRLQWPWEAFKRCTTPVPGLLNVTSSISW
jgi:hypothetical protein